MYDFLWKQLEQRKKPIDVIVVGVGFMSIGFLSSVKKVPSIRIPLIITRDPKRAQQDLEKKQWKVKREDNLQKIVHLVEQGYTALSNNTDLIAEYENNIVIEMTGTITYGTDIALKTLCAHKHLITMNVELQNTVGTELKKIADKSNLVITDVLGDQPGCLSRLISQARFMGFTPRIVGNMKRFLNHQATQEGRKAWTRDKGGSLRKNTSFADGTKQSLELSLVANYCGMKVIRPDMVGPQIDDLTKTMTAFEKEEIPESGAVDYVCGPNLLPGIFMIAEHPDPDQKSYLRYLGLGDGPRYFLYEPYHLCHFEVATTIAKVALFGKDIVNNGLNPTTKTVAMAKTDLKKGDKLDGIGGDLTYGTIYNIDQSSAFLPIGLAEDAVVMCNVSQNQPIALSDVILPKNTATRFLNLT